MPFGRFEVWGLSNNYYDGMNDIRIVCQSINVLD